MKGGEIFSLPRNLDRFIVDRTFIRQFASRVSYITFVGVPEECLNCKTWPINSHTSQTTVKFGRGNEIRRTRQSAIPFPGNSEPSGLQIKIKPGIWMAVRLPDAWPTVIRPRFNLGYVAVSVILAN